MRLITKVAQMGAEGWDTSFEIIDNQETLHFMQSLVKKGKLALSFYVENTADMPTGWAVATEEHVDKRGEVHKVPVKTSAGLYRVYKPSIKAPASVESLKALYGKK